MFLCSKSAEKRFEVSKFTKDVSERAENLHISLTLCALSRGIFSFQSQKFSATFLYDFGWRSHGPSLKVFIGYDFRISRVNIELEE